MVARVGRFVWAEIDESRRECPAAVLAAIPADTGCLLIFGRHLCRVRHATVDAGRRFWREFHPVELIRLRSILPHRELVASRLRSAET